jgi:acid phosphatase type 7
MRRTSARATLTLVALVLFACQGPSDPELPDSTWLGKRPTGTVAKVVVTPASATLQAGATVQLTAQARDRRNKPVAGVTFTWSSSAPSTASVNASGVVSAVSHGAATITATVGGISGTSAITVTVPPPPPSGAVLLAAGDIAQCGSSNDEATAALLDGLAGTVAVLGDNVYERGSLAEYTTCYAPSWGRHKGRTMPSVGNHEYQTSGAAGYYDYFGAAAGDRTKGYYSYQLGDWHIVVLNSNCTIVSCVAGSAQEQWLRADLAAHPNTCTLAYFHHPRFNSGASHGNSTAVQPLWQALYDAGAEIVLSGHEHLYERFAPQTPSGAGDPTRGIRQFTVGTGGRGLYSIGTVKANSEVLNNRTFGVLKLTLAATSYAWEFVPVVGSSFRDAGTANCH